VNKLGQQEVLEILGEKGELTANEIKEYLDVGLSTIRHNLYKLYKHKKVERDVLTKEQLELKGKSHCSACKYYIWRVRNGESE